MDLFPKLGLSFAIVFCLGIVVKSEGVANDPYQLELDDDSNQENEAALLNDANINDLDDEATDALLKEKIDSMLKREVAENMYEQLASSGHVADRTELARLKRGLGDYGTWCGKDNTHMRDPGCSCTLGIAACRAKYRPIDALDEACLKHDYCIACAASTGALLRWCHCEKGLYYGAIAAPCGFSAHCKAYRAAVIAIFGVIPCKCNKKILPCGVKKCTKSVTYPCWKICEKKVWRITVKYPCLRTCTKTITFPCGVLFCDKMITVPNFRLC